MSQPPEQARKSAAPEVAVDVAVDRCPCGSGRLYPGCCGAFHAGAVAGDAEALMRSRYSAYVVQRADYLLATWHPDTRPLSLDLATEPATRWLGLEVRHHQLSAENQAQVEFVARYKVAGRAFRLHETSRFVCEDGRWLYVDGDVKA